MAVFLFFVLSLFTIASVAAMIISRNQAHSALLLVFAFSCLGGLFGLLNAPFVAAAQIIIYAGAIMVLFLFAIMMFGDEPHPPRRKINPAAAAAVLLSIILIIELAAVLRSIIRAPASAAAPVADPSALGELLFTRYLYPFELTSALIIAGLVGAVVLGQKKGEE